MTCHGILMGKKVPIDCNKYCEGGKITKNHEKYRPPSSNGCGPKGIQFVDDLLKRKKLGDLTLCCDDHDKCYGSCNENSSKKTCDEQFNRCMNNTCNRYSRFRSWVCHIYRFGLHKVVEKFGCPFFKKAKDRCSCIIGRLSPY
ncbi:hypothetical protein SNEBB_009686 [Seison nebaliae]|nr:hypothetical protein SNEBB_009686 [Seison nebaliae]